MSKNKVYIDCLQNRNRQTTASVYLLSSTKNATVSTPLDWFALNGNVDQKDFDIKTIYTKLEKKGDLWKEIFESCIDLEKVLHEQL